MFRQTLHVINGLIGLNSFILLNFHCVINNLLDRIEETSIPEEEQQKKIPTNYSSLREFLKDYSYR